MYVKQCTVPRYEVVFAGFLWFHKILLKFSASVFSPLLQAPFSRFSSPVSRGLSQPGVHLRAGTQLALESLGLRGARLKREDNLIGPTKRNFCGKGPPTNMPTEFQIHWSRQEMIGIAVLLLPDEILFCNVFFLWNNCSIVVLSFFFFFSRALAKTGRGRPSPVPRFWNLINFFFSQRLKNKKNKNWWHLFFQIDFK